MTRSTSKQTPFARLVRKKGYGNEYDWPTADYNVGACDSCGITEEHFSNTGAAPRDERWVEAHNQKFHQDETRPQVVGAQPQLQMQLTCGHGVFDETCGQDLRLYEGGWDFDQPLYVCSFGHINEVPQTLAAKDVAAHRKSLDGELEAVHEQFELAAQLTKLQSRQRKVGSPRSRK